MSKTHSCLLALPLLAFAACSTPIANETVATSGKAVRGHATAINRSVQQITDGKIPLFPTGMKGTYGTHCSLHPGETWSLSFSDPSRSTLEVALNDTFMACPLTLTSIEMSSDAALYLVTPPIRLGVAYAETPSSVARSVDKLSFYANAGIFALGIDGTTYASDFAVLLVYSDDPRTIGVTAPPAVYNEINGVAGDSSVKPPDYRLNVDSLRLVVDSNKLVKSDSSGTVTMSLATEASQRGEEWKIMEGTATCCRGYSFATIDKIYTMQWPIDSGSINEANVTIPWTSFGLIGTPLPTYRMLIVKHTGDGGVYSYELFQVLFPGPVH